MALWIKYKQVGLDLKAVLVWAIIWSLPARFFFFTCPKCTPWSKDKCSLKVMELSILGMNYVRQKCLWFYIAWPDLSIIIFIYMIGIDLHLWDRAFAGRLNDIIFSLIWHLPASFDATTMFIWEKKNCDWPLQGGRAAAMQIDHYNAKKLIIHCPCRIFFWCDWVIWLGESWIPSRWKFILGSYSALLWSWYHAFCSQPRGKASYVLS